MSGQRAVPAPVTYTVPMYATSITLRDSGSYRIILWGAGGWGDGLGGVAAGGSGAYIEAVRNLRAGDVITVSTGRATTADGPSSTVTLPSGEILTAGGGLKGANGGTGGIASITGRGTNAADILLNGSLASAAGLGDAGGAAGDNAGGAGAGGAGAPGHATHPGSRGDNASAIGNTSVTPGGGGAFNAGSQGIGGHGMILLEFLGS